MTTPPACRLGGDCELIGREAIFGPRNPGIVQCLKCSTVYEAAGWVPRYCAHCEKFWGESLHDPCLGTLEGVTMACCGHGDLTKAYRMHADGRLEGTMP